MAILSETQQSAPSLPTAVSGLDYYGKTKNYERLQAFSSAQADAQNQLNMSKYNNDYNYWLWQQQTAYNSPEQQVERLKRAGLNPNFNSIEGAGNASSPAPSQGKLNTNFLGAYQASISAREMKIQAANSIINGLNSLVRNIGEGFQLVNSYANIPQSIPEYRDLMMQTLRNTVALGGKNLTRADQSIQRMVHDIAIAQEREKILKYQTGSSSDISFSPYARNFMANTQRILAQKGLINKQGFFVDQQAKKVASDIIVNNFKNRLMASQAALNTARKAGVEYENRYLLPLRGGIAAKQFDIFDEQLKRIIYDNSMMKFDKWFNYGTSLLNSASGFARSFSPFFRSSPGTSIPGFYSPYNF